MGSITSWLRLEPRCRDDEMTESVRARAHDALWMLARQWQVGEFRAEDSGSPVMARWRAESAPLTRLHLGAIAPNTNETASRYDADTLPLEAIVERQRARPADAPSAATSLRLAVEAGLHLLRLVDAQPTSRKYRDAFAQRFTLAPPTADERAAVDAESLEWWLLTAGRAPDGRAMEDALRNADRSRKPLPPELDVSAGDRAEIDVAVDRWLAELDALYSEPTPDAPDAWVSERMEYAFTVAGAHGAEGETALGATQYCEGRLDWSSVDVDLEVNLGSATDRAAVPIVQSCMPAPVTFRGTPSPRFWELEDSRIDYGLIDAGPGDLPHLLLADFATNFGNDWYVIPVDVDVGTLTRTRSLVVTDTFGVQTLVRPSNDPAIGAAAGFSMFQLGVLQRDATGAPLPPRTNLFFLAPSVAKTLEGRPIEEVLLLRDEIANMAWAVERAVPGRLEQRLDLDAYVAPGDETPAPPTETLRYRLATDVPGNWVPLLPQRDAVTKALRLVRAAMLTPDGTNRLRTARGALLNPPGSGLALFDEEVPRAGARITRSAQHVRWFDGSSVLWMGLRNGAGKGEGESGLRFDSADDT